MSRFIIQERLSDKAQLLKEFNLEGYQFNAAESEGKYPFVFKRAEHLAK